MGMQGVFGNLIYKPKQYWNDHGKIWIDFAKQEELLIHYLSDLKFFDVLEFGCGWGRITDILRKHFSLSILHAFDMSQGRVTYAAKKIKEVEFRISSIMDYPESIQYDLLVGVEVLMHVPPDEIESNVDKLFSLTKKYLVTVDYFPSGIAPKKILAEHNFIHDYNKLFSRYGKVTMHRLTKEQALFIVEKN